MATKNLARTVVEGGRAGYSRIARRVANRSERRLRFDAEGDLVHGRPRGNVQKGFADRLAPLERWLEHHVGRGWNNVYREFCARVDRRTLKGWHLDDHLRVMVGLDSFFPASRFVVDGGGILRRRPPRWRTRDRAASYCEREKALAWAGGRRVIVRGDVLFWTALAISPLAPVSPQGRPLTAAETEVWTGLPPDLRQKLTYLPRAVGGARWPFVEGKRRTR